MAERGSSVATAIAACMLVVVSALGVLSGGCLRRQEVVVEEPHPEPRPPAVTALPPVARSQPGRDADDIRPLRRCFSELPAWKDPQVSDLLDRAASFQDEEDFDGVLACAEEAARQAPRSVEAHHN